jgi:hypothetical protein
MISRRTTLGWSHSIFTSAAALGCCCATLLFRADAARGQVAQQTASAKVEPTAPEPSELNERNWELSLEGAYLYGPVNGYIQVPSGGEPGTSSKHRPSFDELGFDNVSIYDASTKFAFGEGKANQLYAGAQIIHLSSKNTLNQDLVSQAISFPSGSPVSSHITLDWYRFGYRRKFVLGERQDFELYPSIGAALLTFHYKLEAPGEPSADRKYSKLTPQVGLEADWRPNRGPLSFEIDLLASPPIDGVPVICVEDALVKYRFYDRVKIVGSGFIGVAFEQIYFEDNQQLSNKINAEFGPMLLLGLEVKF